MAWRKWWIQARSQVSHCPHIWKELTIATLPVSYLLVKLLKLVMARFYGFLVTIIL
jgi:hypothetical protein